MRELIEKIERRERLDLGGSGLGGARKWKEGMTNRDLGQALLDLFNGVGHDLELENEDPSDPAFVDYAGDAMSDAKVPGRKIEKALMWLRKGAKEKYDRETRKTYYVGLED